MGKKKSLTYDTSIPLLAVYLYARRVGTLGVSGSDVWFKYDSWVIDDPTPNRWRLSIRLPITSETYGHEPTLVFFDNLLLESDLRREIASLTKQDSSDMPGLLGRVGGECAGAVAIWPIATEPPPTATYRPISHADLENAFSEAHGARLSQLQLESRQSMSGVQHKLVFTKTGDTYNLPINGSPSSLLLKRTSGRYDGLAINEHACMLLFARLGLQVPFTQVLDGPNGILEIARFDRKETSPGAIERIHQEDFCQASGRRVTAKYQAHGGPGLRDIAEIIRRHSLATAVDIQDLVRAAIANVALGNLDAHAKNFALLAEEDGLRLAPFYDIVCNEAYPDLDVEYSMNFGTARYPRALVHTDLRQFAKDLNVTPKLVVNEIEFVTATFEKAVPEILHDVSERVGAAPILDAISTIVTTRNATLRSMVIAPERRVTGS